MGAQAQVGGQEKPFPALLPGADNGRSVKPWDWVF